MVALHVLKRKDASSVVVAVVLAFVLWGVVEGIGSLLTALVTGSGNGVEFIDFVRPLVALAFQLALLEIAIRVAIVLREGYIKSR